MRSIAKIGQLSKKVSSKFSWKGRYNSKEWGQDIEEICLMFSEQLIFISNLDKKLVLLVELEQEKPALSTLFWE